MQEVDKFCYLRALLTNDRWNHKTNYISKTMFLAKTASSSNQISMYN